MTTKMTDNVPTIVNCDCISVLEMARRMGIGRNTAYLLANSESFYPAFKIGGRRIIINEEALSRWMAEQTSGKGMGNKDNVYGDDSGGRKGAVQDRAWQG